jgi:hypothetical protein
MKKVLIREAVIFAVLLILLAFLMHPDLISGERFAVMSERGNFFHPLLYTFLIYIVLFIVRFLFAKILKIFKKKS